MTPPLRAFWIRLPPIVVVYRMETSGDKLEDRVVEVYWDSIVEGWRMKRFRDDKPTGNHIKTVESIMQSIHDSVERETVRIPQTLW